MLLQQIINGLALGSIYALIALGFSIIYKSTDILNLAHGELMMIFSFFALVFLTKYHFPFILAYVFVLILAGVLGLVLDRLIFRPLIGYPLAQAPVTSGPNIRQGIKGVVLYRGVPGPGGIGKWGIEKLWIEPKKP